MDCNILVWAFSDILEWRKTTCFIKKKHQRWIRNKVRLYRVTDSLNWLLDEDCCHFASHRGGVGLTLLQGSICDNGTIVILLIHLLSLFCILLVVLLQFHMSDDINVSMRTHIDNRTVCLMCHSILLFLFWSGSVCRGQHGYLFEN